MTLIHLAEAVFWLSVSLVFYVYFGYPLTLALLARYAASPASRRRAERAGAPPSVTVVTAAYNEAAIITRTVANKLRQDYPAARLDVVVVSDGSTDDTEERVAPYVGRRVKLLRQAPRQGKTAALNRALDEAQGEIVVFADANSEYDDRTVAALVAAFDDPAVGYVTGRLEYGDSGDGVGGGSGMYMRYENWLRRLETRVGSVVGVNGGVDAVRRHLFRPMRPDQLPDFILPLRVVEAGYRVAFCEGAVCREQSLGAWRDEFKMRVRVSLRALHALFEMRHLLHPRRGLFAFQLLVHKVLRYLLFIPLVGAFAANLVLWNHGFYRWLLVLQVALLGLAEIGWLAGGRIRFKPVFVSFYFWLIQAAAAFALLRFLRGERQVVWTPRKGA